MTTPEFERRLYHILGKFGVTEEEAAPFLTLAHESRHSEGNQAVLWELQELLHAYQKALKARG